MNKTGVTLLGSTGSIGVNTLDVIARHPDRFRVEVLAAHSSVEKMAEQVRRFSPRLAVLFDQGAARRLEQMNLGVKVAHGMDGLLEAAGWPDTQLVVSGMVGAVGLRPTYLALELGRRVALANKETLVLAGEAMVAAAQKSGAVMLPVDSEHNAIFQCLAGSPRRFVERLHLTASGGPFRDLPLERFGEITLAQALAHPNWKMGPKITIDSATMMNKGLEVMEARWLFGVPPENIQVFIHRESIVHSMVEYTDGSVIAQLGVPDMRTPIAYCLGWPDRLAMDTPRLDLAQMGSLRFQPVDPAKYPCLGLAVAALTRGGGAPAVLNGANEVVVAAYLEGRFHFSRIAGILTQVMEGLAQEVSRPQAPPFLTQISGVDDALAADQWGRQAATGLLPG
ncbi:MAG: 1-deoxy-D-xylulose-5-phosphate reductoisomerase [Deltaproteobacteria bacterium]|nr:1-deoxy-D-xylulose-5-phosphate reductoisomerase [Deltaproteobacteria bacterium]